MDDENRGPAEVAAPGGAGAVRDRRGLMWAAGSAAVWFALSYVRYRNHWAGASDLGIFDQAAWLLAHGRAPFITSIGINVFADHVSPVVVLFAPLYRVAATPVWWLAAQALCLGSTVLPMRRLADELGAPRLLASAATVCSAPLLSAAVYDVHPVVLCTPAVAWAILAGRRDDARAATWAGCIVALCRADAVTALIGAAIVARPAARRRLLWLAPLPLVASVVIPHALGTWQTFPRYYRSLGMGWGDFATHFWRIVPAVGAGTAREQLVIWLLPVAFLPLLRPRWLIALVVAGLPLLVSTWPGVPVPWFHHQAFLVPFAVGGALAAWPRARDRAARRARKPARWLSTPRLWRVGRPAFAVVATAGVIAALALHSPASPSAPTTVRLAAVLRGAPPGVEAATKAVAGFGPDVGVSTTNEVLGHLAERDDAYLWPCPFAHLPGQRRCNRPKLWHRANRVEVVVLPGRHDLSSLEPLGFVVTHHAGYTEARR